MTTSTDKGTWRNRSTGGAVLIADEDGDLFHVQVRGSDLPIPVMAKTTSRAKSVLKAQNPPLIAVKVTPGPQDEIDDLLAQAAGEPIDVGGADVTKTTGAVSASIAEKATKGVKVTGEATREAKPDPKPGAKKAAAKAPARKPKERPAAQRAAAKKAATAAKKVTPRKGEAVSAAVKRTAAEQKAAKKGNGTPNARSQKAAADRDKVIALWRDKAFSPETWADGGTARRKAISAKMPSMRGRVLGVLTAAGIDGKGKPAA